MDAITPFGQELRRQRGQSSLMLKDLAEKLKVSAAYLSTVETGAKPLTEKFALQCIDAMEALLPTGFDRKNLLTAAYASLSSIDMRGVPASDKARIGLEVSKLKAAMLEGQTPLAESA